jgi:hypothetical protein
MEWINVKDYIPKNNERVLCFMREHFIIDMRIDSYSEGSDQDSEWFKDKYSHWTIKPEPPKL